MMFRNLYMLGKIFTAYSLLVTPQTIPELEGDLEVYFFCRENNNSFASPKSIVWQDPQGISYIPGSPNVEGNSRISAEGSRLRIVHIVRNDTGIYRCRRSNNSAEFSEGNLFVNAPPAILNAMPVQEIYLSQTSLIKCEVDRGSPLASIHWLHVRYEAGQQVITEITNTSNSRFMIVTDGLQITNVQLTDEGIYRCYVYNSYDTVIRDIQAMIGVPPQPTQKNYNNDVTLNQLEMIDCSVTAFPQPEFQWILQSSGGLFPESSWVSAYHNKTAYSTLMYTFTTRDFNGMCTTVIMCRAQNSYGTSEQYFTLYLNNCSTTSQAHPTPMLLADVSIINDGGKGDDFEGTLIPVIAVAAVIPALAITILLALLLLLRYKRKRNNDSGVIEADSLSVGSEMPISQSKSDIFCTACKKLHDPNSPCISPSISNLDSKQHLDHSYTENAVVDTQPNEAYGKLKCKAPPDIRPHEYATIPLRKEDTNSA